MPGFQLDTTFPDDPDLPWKLTTDSLVTQIAAIPGFIGWWEALPANITIVTDEVTAVAAKAGTGTFTPTSVARRPTLEEDVIAGYEAFAFDSGDLDSMVLGVSDLAMDDDDFTVVALFRSDSTAGSQTVIGRQTDASNRFVVWHINSQMLRLTWGSTGGVGDQECLADEWHLVIAGRSKTDEIARMRLDGVTYSAAAVADSGTDDALCVGSHNTAGGTPFSGHMPLWAAFQSDLFVEEGAVALIEQYVRNVYGLSW